MSWASDYKSMRPEDNINKPEAKNPQTSTECIYFNKKNGTCKAKFKCANIGLNKSCKLPR